MDRGLKRLFGPIYKFLRTFIFKLGVLDGMAGYKLSIMNAKVARKKIEYFDLFKKTEKTTQ